MPIPSVGSLNPDATLQQVIDAYERFRKTFEYHMTGQIDSKNAREFGGFRVSDTTFASKNGIVGMSSAGTSASSVRIWAGSATLGSAPFRVTEDGNMYSTKGNIGGFVIGATSLTDVSGTVGFSSAVTAGDDIRIWAGSSTPASAPFRVTESGAGFASNFTVEGGVIRTAAPNSQRIEMSGGSFKGYTADNLLSGLVFDPGKSSDIVDLFFYHRGTKLAEFFDNITSYRFRGASGALGFGLGGAAATTFAFGAWDFSTASSIAGIPVSAITNLESRLSYLENFAFINAIRVGTSVQFDSKNISNVDSVDVSG